MTNVYDVLKDVAAERTHQTKKWGVQRHTWGNWITILTEEVGESAQEALRLTFGKEGEGDIRSLREELIQVAAVAVAIIEHIDSGEPAQ